MAPGAYPLPTSNLMQDPPQKFLAGSSTPTGVYPIPTSNLMRAGNETPLETPNLLRARSDLSDAVNNFHIAHQAGDHDEINDAAKNLTGAVKNVQGEIQRNGRQTAALPPQADVQAQAPAAQPAPNLGSPAATGRWKSVARGIIGGLAGAAGDEGTAQSMSTANQQDEAHRQALSRARIAPMALNVRNLQAQLASAPPGSPLADRNSPEYNAVVDQIQQNIHAMRVELHPDWKPGEAESLKTHLTDRMHITNALGRADSRAQQGAATLNDEHNLAGWSGYTANTAGRTQQATSAAPYNQFVQQFQQATGRPPTQEESERFAMHQAGLLPTGAAATPSFKNFLTPDGKTVALNAHGPIPEGYILAPTGAQANAPDFKPVESTQGGQLGVQYKGQTYLAGQMDDPKTPPEVKQIWGTMQDTARKAAEDKTRKESETESRFERSQAGIASRFAQALNQREGNEGTWTPAEDTDGNLIFRNNKTNETTPAPAGMHQPGFYQKNIAPLDATKLNVDTYMDRPKNGQKYDGPGDIDLQHQFFIATQVAGRSNMTKPQLELLDNTQSLVNGVRGRIARVTGGTLFSPEQREQIAQATRDALNAKRQTFVKTGPQTQQLQQARKNAGAAPTDDDIINALKKAK